MKLTSKLSSDKGSHIIYLEKEVDGKQKHILLGELHPHFFITYRDSTKHIMKKLNAYGFNCLLIKDMLQYRPGCRIEILEMDTGKKWLTTPEEIAGSQVLQFDNEPQYFIPLELLKDDNTEDNSN